MEQVSYSLRHTVFGILKTLVVRASQNNLDLTYDVDPDIPDQLIGDSLRLRQVITNLVGNAIKFTPSKVTRKGHVALACRLVSIEDSTVKLEFCVTDTGIGIAKDKLTLIFDTFAQADGSTTREYGGTGLGLSISKRLVSLMNGTMWVDSELGKGSRFYFTITSQISQSSIESVLAKMQPFAKRTILFVDTLDDRTGVVDRIMELGLKPFLVRDVMQVADKEGCPHIDTILVDSLNVVRVFYFILFSACCWADSGVFRRSKLESTSTYDTFQSCCWHLYVFIIVLCMHLTKLPVLCSLYIGLTVCTILFCNSHASANVLFFFVVKWCLDNSISSQVTAPATAQDLSAALISALESNTVSPVSAPNDVTFDILLAEDNLVNQKLAVKILEKYGHTVEIAENGSLAVDSFKSRVVQTRQFDIVLVRLSFILPPQQCFDWTLELIGL